MTGPEPFPEAAPHTLLGLANKRGCAPPSQHLWFNGCRRGFYLRRRTQRQERWLGARNSCPLPPPAVCRGGSGLPQGCEELGRTGTFSMRSQREQGFPTNLVTFKLVSQILLSLAEGKLPACFTHFGLQNRFLRC